MMDGYDDGRRFGEGFRDVGVHSHFGGTSAKVVDLLELAIANSGNGRERREGRENLHVRIFVCGLFGS